MNDDFTLQQISVVHKALHDYLFATQHEAIIRDIPIAHDLFQADPGILQRSIVPKLRLHLFTPNRRSLVLVTDMFARKLLLPALQRTAEPEILFAYIS